MADPTYNYFNLPLTLPYAPATSAPQPVALPGSTPGSSFGVEQYVPVARGAAGLAAAALPGALAGGRAELGMVQARYAAQGIRSRITRQMRQSMYGVSPSRQRGALTSSYTRGAQAQTAATATAASGFFKAAKSTLLWSAGISAVENGYKLINHQIDRPTAGANFAGDMTSAAISGTASAVVATAATPMIANMLNVSTKIPLVGIGLLVGIGVYAIADKLLRKTQFFQGIQQGVYQKLGGR